MFKFTVSPDGAEPFTCEATSRDIVKWEATGKGRSIGALTENMRMTDLTDLAYVAASRLGLYAGDIREFRAEVDIDFEQTEADDEMGPTRADR